MFIRDRSESGERGFSMKIMVLDIGGTSIKSGIFENGELSDIRETPTEAKKGGDFVMETAIGIIRSYQEKHTFEKIGISTAGQVNPYEGYIIYANENIPGYTGMPVKKIMEDTFHVPCNVENDVNCAALGEAAFGAGKNERHFACLTYGTGVGGALVLNHRLFHGSTCSAGEFGAMVVHPEDRFYHQDAYAGCYEKYASTTALVKKAMEYDPALSNGRLIFTRMEEAEVQKILLDWVQEIVYGLTTIIHMLNPECVILGGGIMEQPWVLEQIRSMLQPQIMSSFRHVEIKKAALGNQAGMLGAAVVEDYL